MSDFVLDASVALQWFLEDEAGRNYSLAILKTLSEKRAAVPGIWFYEIGNGLLMADRRKRITSQQCDEFVLRLAPLPIDFFPDSAAQMLKLPELARQFGLTNYDAAYLSLALRLKLPLATADGKLRNAAAQAGTTVVTV